MKKTIALIVMSFLFTGYLSAQRDIRQVNSAAYYGIDFSHAKIFGASESDFQFNTMFETINTLILNESKKYDLKKAFSMDFPVQNPKTAVERIPLAVENGLRTDNKNYRITDEHVKEIVAAYSAAATEPGVGMVVICQLLNKQDNQGVWKIVFFDTDTREIIYSRDASGKAKGYGLRNFWAGSFYQVLKKWKY